MLFPSVNLLGVFLAAIANMAIGFLWYSPAVMGKPWMRLMGFTEKSMKEAQKRASKLYSLSFIAAIIQASVIHVVLQMTYAQTLGNAIILGCVLWLGFVAVTQLTMSIFDTKPFSPHLLTINTSYQFLSMLAMTVILYLVG